MFLTKLRDLCRFYQRFQKVFLLICTGLLFLYYSRYHVGKRIDKMLWLGFGPMILYILVVVRVGSETINPALFVPGPFLLFLYDFSSPLKDFFI